MTVLVFRTSVETDEHISRLASVLDSFAGRGAWNFDLTDCDHILRIVSDEVRPEAASHLLSGLGFLCHELED